MVFEQKLWSVPVSLTGFFVAKLPFAVSLWPSCPLLCSCGFSELETRSLHAALTGDGIHLWVFSSSCVQWTLHPLVEEF